MIPQILHQTSKSADLPEDIRRWRASWPAKNPGLDCRFYDDAAARDFVAAHRPDHLALYDGFNFGVMRADYFRYLVVHVSGGLYADTDMECVRSFAPFFALDGALLCVEATYAPTRQKELGYLHRRQFANCIFAAEPGHPFFGALLDRIAVLTREKPGHGIDDIENMTGPRMLSRLFYERNFPGMRVLAQTYWQPSRSYPDVWPFNAKVHARHHFKGSWKDPRARLTIHRRLIERDLPHTPLPARMFIDPFSE